MYNGYEIYIHPEWNPSTMAGDIAMIKLSTIVTYTRNSNNAFTGWLITLITFKNGMEQNTFVQFALRVPVNRLTSTAKLPLLDGVQLLTVLHSYSEIRIELALSLLLLNNTQVVLI
jgi:hypothetical protein